jgi:phosphomannomutase
MNKLLFFDVDGTLAQSTLQITKEMEMKLKEIYNKGEYQMCIVGGGTYEHIIYQLGKENEKLFSHIFSENGLVIYKNGELFHKNDIKLKLGEELIQKVLNFTLRYIANLDIPYKRGSFVRFRTGMCYVTPMGGDCSKKERAEFAEYDLVHNVRSKMIKTYMDEFEKDGIVALLGGQIGIGVHPKGWDKSYALQFIDLNKYESVSFFGDRCTPTGNDYPLFSHKDIKGHFVKSPEHTLELLDKL